MNSLTTRQRDLLLFLLNCNDHVVIGDIAKAMALTSRQVNYSLKGVRSWLALKELELKITPGVGIEIPLADATKARLISELETEMEFHLVLSAGQRQQLFALNLLIAQEPLILYKLQQIGQASRTTVLKDLEAVEKWVDTFGLKIERRPNYGIWVSGSEKDRRQTVAALLWGQVPFEDVLWQMNHRQGLIFALEQDAHRLPWLEEISTFLQQLNIQKMMQWVASAEADLGGRFSDQAVLHLSLMLAIQNHRLLNECYLQPETAFALWYDPQHIGRVAQKLFAQLNLQLPVTVEQSEVGMLAILLLTCAKDTRWPGDLDVDGRFSPIINQMMQTIGTAYRLPELADDAALRDGLITSILPACLRQQFHVWTPHNRQPALLNEEKYSLEKELAHSLIEKLNNTFNITLLDQDAENLMLLLRAAFIRERPQRQRKVIVVCPSGMATAQLLTARLKVRFPRLGQITVVSMRELTEERLEGINLIITTVPLSDLQRDISTIQVNPQLLPEDIARITEWLV